MTLAATVDKIEDVPEAIRPHYVQEGEKYVLKVEGMKHEADFQRFEEALRKRLADTTSELKALQGQQLKRDDIVEILRGFAAPGQGGKGGGGDGDDPKVADLERQLAAAREAEAAASKARDEAVTAHRVATLTGSVARAVAEAAPRAESAETIVRLAADYFEVAQDGAVKSKLHCEFGPDLTPGQLLAKMKTDPRFAPFWPPSAGSGAGGGGGGASGGGGDNPWTAAHWNQTRQAEIITRSADEADRLAKAAGVPLHATRRQAEAVARATGKA